MTRLVAVLFLLTLSCSAGENRHFFGEWTPPKSLQEFWAPIDESWWNKGYTPKLDQRCRDFAKRSKPAKLVPDIIEDLRASPSEVRWFVYLNVMRFWKKNDVLKALSPFQKSSDANVRHIANEFVADLE